VSRASAGLSPVDKLHSPLHALLSPVEAARLALGDGPRAAWEPVEFVGALPGRAILIAAPSGADRKLDLLPGLPCHMRLVVGRLGVRFDSEIVGTHTPTLPVVHLRWPSRFVARPIRDHKRTAVKLVGEIAIAAGPVSRVQVLDLSLAGARVVGAKGIATGDAGVLTVHLPDGAHAPATSIGVDVTVRSARSTGCGLAFGPVDARARLALANYLIDCSGI
jgi:hypothetical protein